MNFSDKLRELRKSKNITQYQMAQDIGISMSSVAMWESSSRTPPVDMIIRLSKYFNVSVDYLLGMENCVEEGREDIIKFPVIAKVRAGFDHSISETGSGEYQEVPRSILGTRSEKDMLVFLVEGDSMAPKFLEGDRVLVSRQTSVDSGDIAIVSYRDYENGTIKKVHYETGCDYVDLIPLNPKYTPVRIQGEALEGVRVVGKVVYLFRRI